MSFMTPTRIVPSTSARTFIEATAAMAAATNRSNLIGVNCATNDANPESRFITPPVVYPRVPSRRRPKQENDDEPPMQIPLLSRVGHAHYHGHGRIARRATIEKTRA